MEKEPMKELEKCRRHPKDKVKFYCTLHEQVGCPDCMIFNHKTCKVEYIADMARTFKESKGFKELVQGVDKCRLEAQETLSSVNNNKTQVIDVNEKFTRDVNTFKEEMIAHVTELTNAMLRQGENAKNMDVISFDQLKQEGERLTEEITVRAEELESQLDNKKNRNKIEMYEFKRDEDIDRAFKECKHIGNLKRAKERNDTNNV